MQVNNNDLYVYDNYLRSFENREVLIEVSRSLSDDAKLKIINNIPKENIKLWQITYNYLVKYIIDRCKIVVQGDLYPVSNVLYHEKYGWTMTGKRGKAYLGKVSLLDSLSITMGNHSYISGNSILRGVGEIHIGSYTSIGWGLYVFVDYENHPFNYAANINFAVESRLIDDGQAMSIDNPMENNKNSVNIGDDVFIGRDVSIMNNTTIGNGCVIGAKSLVTKDCLPYGIYAGTPAKLIRMRFSEKIINQLTELEWWNWTEGRIKRNVPFFSTDLSNYEGDLMKLIIG